MWTGCHLSPWSDLRWWLWSRYLWFDFQDLARHRWFHHHIPTQFSSKSLNFVRCLHYYDENGLSHSYLPPYHVGTQSLNSRRQFWKSPWWPLKERSQNQAQCSRWILWAAFWHHGGLALVCRCLTCWRPFDQARIESPSWDIGILLWSWSQCSRWTRHQCWSTLRPSGADPTSQSWFRPQRLRNCPLPFAAADWMRLL